MYTNRKELPKLHIFLHLPCILQEDNESMYFYVIISFVSNLFSFVMMLHNLVAP